MKNDVLVIFKRYYFINLFINFIIGIILGSILLFIGFSIGLVVNDFPGISLSSKLSFGEICSALSLLVTICLAIGIPIYLNKRIDNRRAEKDILIDTFTKFEAQLKEIEIYIEKAYLQSVKEGNIEKDLSEQITSRLKGASEMLSLLIKNLREHQDGKEVKNITPKLFSAQIVIWKNVTAHFGGIVSKIGPKEYRISERAFCSYFINLTKLILIINNGD